jgi:hypothetical protein
MKTVTAHRYLLVHVLNGVVVLMPLVVKQSSSEGEVIDNSSREGE